MHFILPLSADGKVRNSRTIIFRGASRYILKIKGSDSAWLCLRLRTTQIAGFPLWRIYMETFVRTLKLWLHTYGWTSSSRFKPKCIFVPITTPSLHQTNRQVFQNVLSRQATRGCFWGRICTALVRPQNRAHSSGTYNKQEMSWPMPRACSSLDIVVDPQSHFRMFLQLLSTVVCRLHCKQYLDALHQHSAVHDATEVSAWDQVHILG